MKKEVVRYSEAFKLQIVSEIESGKFKSIFEAMKRYDIRGTSTIQRWIEKYGKNHLLNKVVVVKTVEERDQVKELKQRIRQLETALSNAHLDLCLEKSWVGIACKQAGIEDVEAFKKKVDMKQYIMVQK